MTPTATDPSPLLLYADTESSADQRYLAGFIVPDAFPAIIAGKRRYAILNSLEYGRAKKESRFHEILSWEEWQEKAQEMVEGEGRPGAAEIIARVARELGIAGFTVPEAFPLGMAEKLRALGLAIEPAGGEFFPRRQIKSDAEAEEIRRGNDCAAAGLRAAEELLRRSRVRGGWLVLQDRPLTSERLKEEIEIACLRAGGISAHTIAAGGEQACDPHCTGSGPLRAHELIIVDVFPRLRDSGYHGDMTRTFLRGRAPEDRRRLVETVREGQRRALRAIHSGVTGDRIQKDVTAYFDREGFATSRESGQAKGFFHGVGHGLGLEVHEAPRISYHMPRLRKGQVVTVEPGLYYPGLGGARIEDVIRVGAKDSEMLSHYHGEWELD